MLTEGLPATATEGDVETQVVLPLLTRAEYLSIELATIKSKEFLPAFDIGKGSKSRKGYVPDYCVYALSIPILVVEVKAPSVNALDAWEEASLYAHALNKRFNSDINPCRYTLATNGREIHAGKWDRQKPIVSGNIADLIVGSDLLAKLQGLIGSAEIERIAALDSAALKLVNLKRPFNQGEGPVLIQSKLDPNTFAADLAPILRRYFSSRDQNKDPEIYKNAYVSSNEVTSYDKILESFLVDRLSRSRSRTEIQTTRKKADEVSRRLSELAANRSASGELQLITGGVGTGKSLFARRYKEYLQPEILRQASHWAFIDFNFINGDLKDASDEIYAAFVKSVIEEGAPIDPRNADDQERIFSSDVQDREAFYQRMESASPGRGLLERARDIEGWRQDPARLAQGISRHLQGDRGDVLIVVFDNVDRRDAESQMAAFQLALWFMDQLRCLVILQMRDTTFEAYKHEKPLDTYKTGTIFHISPPRFIDVVKRRLELSLDVLQQEAPQTIKYVTPSGLSINYPKKAAGDFLRGIYLELFQRPTNISRVLEALAGRNVRKALDMFMAIITSGHMPENMISSVANGIPLAKFPEYLILRILMRQDYRFYSDNSGFISNIFYTSNEWARPTNFLVVEMLFFLIGQRKKTGDNGQMGFVSLVRLKDHLERFGFVRSDVHKAAQYVLGREMIEADSAATLLLTDSVCLKASASGWAHLRILSSREEYLASILPTTPLNDGALNARVFDLMQTENRHGRISAGQRAGLLEGFRAYLQRQFNLLNHHPGYAETKENGGRYILAKVDEALAFERTTRSGAGRQLDWLDS